MEEPAAAEGAADPAAAAVHLAGLRRPRVRGGDAGVIVWAAISTTRPSPTRWAS